jgi:hypothetical protein
LRSKEASIKEYIEKKSTVEYIHGNPWKAEGILEKVERNPTWRKARDAPKSKHALGETKMESQRVRGKKRICYEIEKETGNLSERITTFYPCHQGPWFRSSWAHGLPLLQPK